MSQQNHCNECQLNQHSTPIFDLSETTGKLFFVRMSPGWFEDKNGAYTDSGGQYLRELCRGTVLEGQYYMEYIVHCFRYKLVRNESGWEYREAMPPTRQHILMCHASYFLSSITMREPHIICCFGKKVFAKISRMENPDIVPWGGLYAEQETPIMLLHDPQWVLSHPRSQPLWEKQIRKLREYL